MVYLPMYLTSPTETNGKRGIGVANQYTAFTCRDAMALGVAWYYDWGATPTVCWPSVEAVGMAWGAVPERIGGNSAWLLGFNEPDLSGQANIPPDRAATLWREIETRYPDRLLVAPVPGNPAGGWLEGFYKSYWTRFGRPPKLDALAMHCYSNEAAPCIQVLEWYKQKARSWGVGEVWVTEFAFVQKPIDLAKSAAEMRTFTDYLERDPMVGRFAWWNARHTGREEWAFGEDVNPSLIDFYTGQLTSLGATYRELQ